MKKTNKIIKIIATAALISAAAVTLASCASAPKASGKKVVSEDQYWLEDSVPSLYKTYSDYFDYIGIACEHRELLGSEVQNGFSKHVNSTTMGNEFKPDFIFNWGWGQYANKLTDFTDSHGTTIKVPAGPLTGFNKVDAILSICNLNNIKLRGHVLVWHSQTPEEFFKVDYNKANPLVDKATMTARQEWYIKTVIEHVQEWEAKHTNGEHVVWAWDVVNEAISDGAPGLRTDSNWYKIYGNSEFVVNAFRFANKYVAPDVLLVYNDYGCTSMTKRRSMLNLLDDILAAKNDSTLPTRIDAMGMQSHISVNTGLIDFQNAINDFKGRGLDVQVTELDIATEASYDAAALRKYYKNIFTMLLKNRKTEGTNGVTAITIWGINDENTWLNSPSQIKWHGNVKQFPLLFVNIDRKYITKPAFFGVIEAAQEFSN